jgi:AhpD family alkylhydroperoxidase
MLESAHGPLTTDPQLVASMLQGMMVGVSRRMLESCSAEKQLDTLGRELIFAACAYLDACSSCVPVHHAAGNGGADNELCGEVLQMGKKDTAIRLKGMHR